MRQITSHSKARRRGESSRLDQDDHEESRVIEDDNEPEERTQNQEQDERGAQAKRHQQSRLRNQGHVSVAV